MKEIAVPISEVMRRRLGRVGVLYGGLSSEREVSLLSGKTVIDALTAAQVEVVAIDLQDDPITQIQQEKLDRVFIAMHGPGGEDGRIQATLEFMGLPYTGSGVQASALAMDKLRCKQLWRGIGLPTPDFQVLDKDSDWQRTLTQLGGDVFVKPVNEGSSIGIARANTSEQLKKAYFGALKFDHSVLVEQFIAGAEYTVAILNGQALPAIRMETDNTFYDYEAKYLSDDTRYFCPCGLSAEKESQLADLAIAAFNSLGCAGWGRVDVMADDDSNFYLLEVNTVPGMTTHSLVPMAVKAKGFSFEEFAVMVLVDTLVDDD